MEHPETTVEVVPGAGREGRAVHEGSVWTIEAMGGRGLAKEMVAALRREACRWRIG